MWHIPSVPAWLVLTSSCDNGLFLQKIQLEKTSVLSFGISLQTAEDIDKDIKDAEDERMAQAKQERSERARRNAQLVAQQKVPHYMQCHNNHSSEF